MLQSTQTLTQRAMRVLQLARRTHQHAAGQVSAQALALAELVSEHLPGLGVKEADCLVAAAILTPAHTAHLVSLEEVLTGFGPQVHVMVRVAAELQPPPDDQPGNQQYCELLRQAPWSVKTIKLAELFLSVSKLQREHSGDLDKIMRALVQVRALAGGSAGLYSHTYNMVFALFKENAEAQSRSVEN